MIYHEYLYLVRFALILFLGDCSVKCFNNMLVMFDHFWNCHTIALKLCILHSRRLVGAARSYERPLF